MRILITGGAGYKGVYLTKKLLSLGHQVAILDNFMYGYDSVLHMVDHPELSIITQDIRSLEEKTLKDFDAVVHLAGVSGYPACEANPHSAQLINVDASRNLGKLLSKDQILIYASTTSFYGKSGKICTEETPVEPVSLYGKTKYQGEQILLERENTIALRLATIFGLSPKMRIDLMVNDFVYKAVNERCIVLFESQSKRTFLHISDAISAYVFALDNFGVMRHGIFNVGDDSLNFSKLEIAENIRKYTDCKIIDSDIEDFDVRNFLVSFEKLRNLGYSVSVTLDDGIKELVKLYGFYKPFTTYKTI